MNSSVLSLNLKKLLKVWSYKTLEYRVLNHLRNHQQKASIPEIRMLRPNELEVKLVEKLGCHSFYPHRLIYYHHELVLFECF